MKIFWHKQSFDNLPSSSGWLHPEEQKILAGYKFPKKKKDYLLGRWTAKKAVSQYLNDSHPQLTFDKIEIRRAEDGAPEVFFEDQLLPVFISLSHSHDIGFCVISKPGQKLGCDLEKIEPRSEAFIKDYFTKNELNIISKTKKEDLPLTSNLIWSAKESALKAIRTGLRIDTRKVEVSFKNEGKKWNQLSVMELGNNEVFNGFWSSSKDFVFTILSKSTDWQPIEMK